jgi:pimeloyl-ACP methyl ester carboxylesterase
LDALDLRGVTAIGESSGATNALMAAMRSDRVVRVVALDPYDHAENLDGGTGVASTWLGKANFAMMDLFGAAALYPAGAPIMGPAMMHSLLSVGVLDSGHLPYGLIQEQVRQGRQAGYRGPQLSLFQERDWFEVPERYPDMPAEVAVTLSYADHDWSHPGSRAEVARLLVTDTNDAAVTVQGSGHFSALDQPEQVIAIIDAALERDRQRQHARLSPAR